jgi:thioredoxin-dependent peroxiredoxin
MLDWFFSKPLPAGTPAPDFTLADQNGNRITLSALRGRNVVLIFYPADETPTCRQQLCEFRDRWPLAESRNTAVFGVNPQSAASHAKFRDKRAFPFPLLVDEGKHVADLYNAGGLIVRRTVYLIGPDGIIRYAQRGKPAPDEVLSAAVIS